eukprot:SAG31_NODE_67_length_28318_cov_6.493674_35_plen_154_part_00
MSAPVEELLAAALASAAAGEPAACRPLTCEPVAAVAGAFIIRSVFTPAETEQLSDVVRLAHHRREQEPQRHQQKMELQSLKPEAPRRDSQHHVPISATADALLTLAARLRPYLPAHAGPCCKDTLAPPGEEISTFLRCYLYQAGDGSKPHFDR